MKPYLTDDDRSEIASHAARRKWTERNEARVEGMEDTPRTIVLARLRRAMGQSEAAREVGISAVTLSRIESNNPRVAEQLVIKALAWAVGPHSRDHCMPALKPRYQRPLSTDPPPVHFTPPPEPPPIPVMLFSGACPFWGCDIRISVATCDWTREAGKCGRCPGVAQLEPSCRS